MVETLAPLTYGRVIGRYGVFTGDSADAGDEPDFVPLTGFIYFTSTARKLLVATALPDPATGFSQKYTAIIDANGYVSYNGAPGIKLIATDGPTNPTNFQYHVEFDLKFQGHTVQADPFNITVPTGTTQDLTLVTPVVAAAGQAITRGPAGPPGVNWRGAFSSAANPAYSYGDLVIFNGNTYFCKIPSPNTTLASPSDDPSSWDLFVASGGSSGLVLGTTAGTAADAGAMAIALSAKADNTTVAQQLSQKADAAATTQALGQKADATATANSLLQKAPLLNPIFQGVPQVPTAPTGTNSQQAASTAFVKSMLDAMIAGAPSALDTLAEIDAQLSNDESAVAALTATVASKVPQTRTIAGKPLSADITLNKNDVSLNNVDNTSDVNKPISTATQTALNAKAADNDVVHLEDGITYNRIYTAGAWQLRGTIPAGSKADWAGPVSVGPPPLGGNYAVAGVDTYTGTVG